MMLTAAEVFQAALRSRGLNAMATQQRGRLNYLFMCGPGNCFVLKRSAMLHNIFSVRAAIRDVTEFNAQGARAAGRSPA